MSFALTTAQVLAKQKTVTRRLGWQFLKVGDLLQPIVKGQGLKKGQHVAKIGGPIRVIDIRRERVRHLLDEEPYGSMEVQREGFGGEMTPRMFVEFFCRTHRLDSSGSAKVTRIEFEYTA